MIINANDWTWRHKLFVKAAVVLCMSDFVLFFPSWLHTKEVCFSASRGIFSFVLPVSIWFACQALSSYFFPTCISILADHASYVGMEGRLTILVFCCLGTSVLEIIEISCCWYLYVFIILFYWCLSSPVAACFWFLLPLRCIAGGTGWFVAMLADVTVSVTSSSSIQIYYCWLKLWPWGLLSATRESSIERMEKLYAT